MVNSNIVQEGMHPATYGESQMFSEMFYFLMLF